MWTEFCHGLCSMRRESWIFHFCSRRSRKEKSVAILEFKFKRKWNQNLKQEPHFEPWFDTNFSGKFESFDFEADGYDRFVNWLQRFHALSADLKLNRNKFKFTVLALSRGRGPVSKSACDPALSATTVLPPSRMDPPSGEVFNFEIAFALFRIAAVINKLTNENTSRGCHIALPAFFQTTSVALAVDTAHKVKMAKKKRSCRDGHVARRHWDRISNLTNDEHSRFNTHG